MTGQDSSESIAARSTCAPAGGGVGLVLSCEGPVLLYSTLTPSTLKGVDKCKQDGEDGREETLLD